LIPYLKKIGFVASDGSPTNAYKQFRNHATAGAAAAAAVKTGYKALEQVNEYFYDLTDKDLLALITQVTGVEEGNQVAKLTLSTLKTLKTFANFDAKSSEVAKDSKDGEGIQGLGNWPKRREARKRTPPRARPLVHDQSESSSYSGPSSIQCDI